MIPNYFCGWYFKCQSKTDSIAIIPAFHQSKGKKSCSIQVITKDNAYHVNFPNFCFSKPKRNNPYFFKIQEMVFCKDRLEMNLYTEELKMFGSLVFTNKQPLRYNIMGPFHYMPFMECRHSVFSTRHTVNGTLNINGIPYEFDNAIGYLEGDRGTSFPRSYMWTHCFRKNLSIMLSVAEIPITFLPFCKEKTFTGIIGIIAWNKKEYRFATYLGAKVKKIEEKVVVIKQGNYQLTVKLLENVKHSLYAPKGGQMVRIIKENIACRAKYRLERLEKNKRKTILFEFETKNASFEFEY